MFEHGAWRVLSVQEKYWKLSSFEKGQIDIPGERKLMYSVACIFHTQRLLSRWLETEEALSGIIIILGSPVLSSPVPQGDFQEGCQWEPKIGMSSMKKERYLAA